MIKLLICIAVELATICLFIYIIAIHKRYLKEEEKNREDAETRANEHENACKLLEQKLEPTLEKLHDVENELNQYREKYQLAKPNEFKPQFKYQGQSLDYKPVNWVDKLDGNKKKEEVE